MAALKGDKTMAELASEFEVIDVAGFFPEPSGVTGRGARLFRFGALSVTLATVITLLLSAKGFFLELLEFELKIGDFLILLLDVFFKFFILL